MAVAAIGVTTIDVFPVAIFHSAVARSSCSSGCGDRLWNGSTSRAGKETTESGSHAAVSSQNPRRMGTKSSTARLSLTTTISGRSAARRHSTSSRALAVGESPETRILPVPSFRWEATRVKPGSNSTSAKSSRTKGSSMPYQFYQELGSAIAGGAPLATRAGEWNPYHGAFVRLISDGCLSPACQSVQPKTSVSAA